MQSNMNESGSGADPSAIRETFDRFTHGVRFDPFFKTHYRGFARRARYCFPACLDSDIEDAWQAALLAVYESPGNFRISAAELVDVDRFEARLAVYIKGAAMKKLISRIRVTMKNLVTLKSLDELQQDEAKLDKLLFDLDAIVPGPEITTQWARRRKLVEQCLSKLTELARETFILALGGHKDIDIQRITNAGSAVAVRRRISETKTRVMACVESQMGGAA